MQNVVQSSSYLHRYGNFNDKTGNFIGADSSQDDGSGFTAPVGSYLPNPMIPGPRFSRSLAAPRRATAQPAHPAQDG